MESELYTSLKNIIEEIDLCYEKGIPMMCRNPYYIDAIECLIKHEEDNGIKVK